MTQLEAGRTKPGVRFDRLLGWILLPVFVWGTTYVAVDIAMQFAGVMVIVMLRSIIGGLALIAVTSRWSLPRPSMWPWIGAIGLFNTALLLIGIAVATARVGAAGAAVLTATSPLLVAAWGYLFVSEKLTLIRSLALLLGLLGVGLTVLEGLRSPQHGWYWIVGLLFGLVASASFAVTTRLTRVLQQRRREVDLVELTAWQLIVGAIIVFPLSLTEFNSTQVTSLVFWISIAYLSLATLVNWCWFRALRDVESSYASSFIFLVPVVSAGIELARGNFPSPITFIGMLVTVLAVFLATRPSVVVNSSATNDHEVLTQEVLHDGHRF
jgi:drug/metabolite transporter (DMT)-like permease